MGETTYYTVHKLDQAKSKTEQLYISYLIVESNPPTGHFCRVSDISPIHIIVFERNPVNFRGASVCVEMCRGLSDCADRLQYYCVQHRTHTLCERENRAYDFNVNVVDESHYDQILLIFFLERRILQVINEIR